jgi:hypothetical protein
MKSCKPCFYRHGEDVKAAAACVRADEKCGFRKKKENAGSVSRLREGC